MKLLELLPQAAKFPPLLLGLWGLVGVLFLIALGWSGVHLISHPTEPPAAPGGPNLKWRDGDPTVARDVNMAPHSALAYGANAKAKVENHYHDSLPPDSLWAKMGVAGAPDLGALNSKYPWGYFTFFAEENGPFQIQAGSPLRSQWKLDVTRITASFSPGVVHIRIAELVDTSGGNHFTNINFILPSKGPNETAPSSVFGIEFMAEVVALNPRGIAGVLGFRPPSR